MSILIQGVRMPKDCRECPFFGHTAEDEFMCLIQNGEDSCRLEKLPPHGRLIDADALMANAKLRIFSQSDLPYFKRFANLLEFAPTIIPADPEGGGSGNV